ncbi:T9SS type A sorting domain-containing protein [Arachidicoccus terrestris]|uniref:T9SS type A sorting domain-containing protein n=1 Tax=Arachidicoccus terrestris TaxID=2875539 RepID=UPI001CC68474|nr:T9SS type A sorting domain-containing protein [Arachidicoccus terrestris]UAY55558.1 T9SS type A sorting domain-containing protein [Arachidicoccus terrestris]
MKHLYTKTFVRLSFVLFFTITALAGWSQQFRTVNSGYYITALTKDGAGNLYFTKFNSGSSVYDVVKYDPLSGTETAIYTGLQYSAVDYPFGLAVDSQGDVFVAGSNVDNKVIKLTYDAGANSYTASDFMAGTYINAIAIDQDDNFYTSEYVQTTGVYRIVRYSSGATSGGTVLYDNITVAAGYSYTTSIVVAPNKDIYFNMPFGGPSSPDQGEVVKISAADNYATPVTISSGKYSTAVALDPTGNLYVSEYDAGTSSFILNKYTGATGTPTSLYTLDDATGFFSWGIIALNSKNIYFTTGSSDAHPGGALMQLFDNPEQQATNITVSNQTTTDATLSWTGGTGEKRAVFVAALDAGAPGVLNNTTYSANSQFGSGTADNTGLWYCVYNGQGNTITVTGLQAGQTYRVMVLDYNGVPGSEIYNTATATGNPVNFDEVALPVTWENFEMQYKEGKYIWNWQIGVESQIAYYVPQYSLDGNHYIDAGKITRKEPSLHYQFAKEITSKGLLYFRVQSVDNNGKKSYSAVKTVNGNTGSLHFYPNPASTYINVVAADKGILQVYSPGGQLVLRKILVAGSNRIQLDGLAAGIYIGKVNNMTFKFVKQ